MQKKLRPNRAFNADARKILVDIFQRAIEAVEMGLVEDVGDLGLIAKVLIEFACELEIEDVDSIVRTFNDSTCQGSDGPTYGHVFSGLFGEYWYGKHSAVAKAVG
ncbi:MAG TPA: hypothetical protein VM260_22895 [Pirellula sp.]|nr:hypothetical protein [Pirellula sp.]